MSKGIPVDQVALPGDLKRVNRQRILQALRTGRPMTASEIHDATGISRPTIMRALQHYCAQGVVESLGLGQTTSMGGKKPELFAFADRERILCLNLWPERVTFALCGMIGDVYAMEAHACRPGDTLDEAFETLGRMTPAYLARQGIERLYGVALTLPGTVNYDTRHLRYNSQAPGWGADVPLEPWMEKLFGTGPAFFVENAGKAAGRAVLLDAEENSRPRLLTLFTTWGVSACMIEHGHVLGGRDSLIGEIGHMLISENGPALCGCGKRGCLESLVSVANVRRMMREEGANAPESLRELFALSEAGHAAAQKTVRYLAHCFAVALHNLSLSYNQEAVVFQGDYAWADDVFDQHLRQELRQFRYFPEGEPFAITYDRRDLALLAALGGAERLRKRYFDEIQ